MKKIILVGGGTGGHCLPIKVLFNSLIQKKIDCYIVTDKRGKHFFNSINQDKVLTLWQFVESNRTISQIINIPFLFIQSIMIYLKLNPRFTIGFGGFITFPFILSGSFMNYKVAAHEANAVVGKANRLLLRNIKYLFTAFRNTKNTNKISSKKIVHVGLPIRVYRGSINKSKELKDSFIFSVIGGSQGAKDFSKCVPKAIQMFQAESTMKCFVNHQGLEDDLKFIKNFYCRSKINSDVKSYFSDMPKIIFESDLIISRSGSSTVNEIIFYNKPSVLVPYPYAADNHQYYNALSVLEQISNSTIILNKDLNSRILYLEILKIFKNTKKRKYIGNSVSRISYSNPSECIYNFIKNDL